MYKVERGPFFWDFTPMAPSVMFLYFCSKLVALAQLGDLTLPWIIYQLLQRNKSRVSLSPPEVTALLSDWKFTMSRLNSPRHLGKDQGRGAPSSPWRLLESCWVDGSVYLVLILFVFSPWSIERQADLQLDNLHNLASTRKEDKFSFTQSQGASPNKLHTFGAWQPGFAQEHEWQKQEWLSSHCHWI